MGMSTAVQYRCVPYRMHSAFEVGEDVRGVSPPHARNAVILPPIWSASLLRALPLYSFGLVGKHGRDDMAVPGNGRPISPALRRTDAVVNVVSYCNKGYST